jgi:hypothetical protein
VERCGKYQNLLQVKRLGILVRNRTKHNEIGKCASVSKTIAEVSRALIGDVMYRSIICALALASGGCASMQARSNAVDTAEKQSQIVVTVDQSADQTTPMVLDAFMKNGLSVSTTSPGLIEAKLSPEPCFGGKCSIAARALILASGSSTHVTLYADESRDIGSSVKTQRASALSRGRAGDTWKKLNAIAMQIQPDASKRAVNGNP